MKDLNDSENMIRYVYLTQEQYETIYPKEDNKSNEDKNKEEETK